MNEADPVLRLLGLAARAGGIVPGTARVGQAARAGELRFAIVAADASRNSRDKVLPVLEARSVAHVVGFDRDQLGAAIGRAPVSAVGVTSGPLADRVSELLAQRRAGSAPVDVSE